jgi:hypothetical protein
VSRAVQNEMRRVRRPIVSDFQQRLALDPSLGSNDKLPGFIEGCIAQFARQTAHAGLGVNKLFQSGGRVAYVGRPEKKNNATKHNIF